MSSGLHNPHLPSLQQKVDPEVVSLQVVDVADNFNERVINQGLRISRVVGLLDGLL